MVHRDDELGYSIRRLDEPLAPGAAVELGFELTVGSRGFGGLGAAAAIVGNGTYLTRRDAFPVVGYDERRQLVDREERRRQGLDPELPPAARDDAAARRRTPRASDADRVAYETVVSTAADQIAVASGELVRAWTAGGRRHFHYRARVPITHHFAYVSARYEVTRSAWNGIAVEVYHHPGHAAGARRILAAAEAALADLTGRFGPYPRRHLRIVETPRRVRDATSFPGMIAMSESLGFEAPLADDAAIDYPFYVTAHEVAHQWWGQQVVGAAVEGVAALHETLAQYSALTVLEDAAGRPAMRSVLAAERDLYLRGRGDERDEEPPLARVVGQEYVSYHKGALAMVALRDAIGGERLDRALASFFARHAAAGPPYPTTADLLAEIRREAPAAGPLLEDLFETVTLYDHRIAAATAARRPDGRHLVRLDVEARKLRVEGDGTEREVAIGGRIDVAVYGERLRGDAAETLLLLAPRPVDAPRTTLELVVDGRPTRVELDPFHKLVDRDRGDDVRAVSPLPAR